MNGLANGHNGQSVDLSSGRVFNDSVHGTISLPPLCIAIIDTPQFQRLRYLKQVGTSSFVYPAASHTRFEHCLGVAHLAGEMVRCLRKNQKEDLCITDVDELCVQVAGLCHDLGHGPFSHLWEQFVKINNPVRKWKHEDCSVSMLQYLLQENRISLSDYGLVEDDLIFIQEMIKSPCGSKMLRGRPNEKRFLYEIVANHRNGIDVDKWDYFRRDSLNLGLSNSFSERSYTRLMNNCLVFNVPGQGMQICFRDKEVENIQEMFHTRYTLHFKAYQHKTSKTIDVMLLDALHLVDQHLTTKSKDGRILRLSETVDDMYAFSKLTDYLLLQIEFIDSQNEKVLKAQQILHNLKCRKLYPFIGHTFPEEKVDEVTLKEQLVKNVSKLTSDDRLRKLASESVIFAAMRLNYGMGAENPLHHINFYTKKSSSNLWSIRKSEMPSMISFKHEEVVYRVFSRCYDKDVVMLLKDSFKEACNTLKVSIQEETCNTCLTPLKKCESLKPTKASSAVSANLSFQ